MANAVYHLSGPCQKMKHYGPSALDEDEFANLVLGAFGNTLGGLKLDGPRLSWPLNPLSPVK